MQNMFNESMTQSEKIVTAAGMPISKEQKSYLHNLMMYYKHYSEFTCHGLSMFFMDYSYDIK